MVQLLANERDFFFSKTFKLALQPIKPPIQWLPDAFSPSVKMTWAGR
jgi:hypothetical protein